MDLLVNNLPLLPSELITQILANLSLKEVLKCKLLNKKVNSVINDDYFWAIFVEKNSGPEVNLLYQYTLKLFISLNKPEWLVNLPKLYYNLKEELAFEGSEYLFNMKRNFIQAGRQNDVNLFHYFMEKFTSKSRFELNCEDLDVTFYRYFLVGLAENEHIVTFQSFIEEKKKNYKGRLNLDYAYEGLALSDKIVTSLGFFQTANAMSGYALAGNYEKFSKMNLIYDQHYSKFISSGNIKFKWPDPSKLHLLTVDDNPFEYAAIYHNKDRIKPLALLRLLGNTDYLKDLLRKSNYLPAKLLLFKE